jgi:hypothetical protein
VTADRDGIGSRGQNKGFAKGKFFAIFLVILLKATANI